MAITGDKIKTARLAVGISQEKAARQLDVALNTWARWEQGKQQPHLDTLRRIAKLLGVPPGELV